MIINFDEYKDGEDITIICCGVSKTFTNPRIMIENPITHPPLNREEFAIESNNVYVNDIKETEINCNGEINFDWHDLTKNSEDLPDKNEKRKILFYVKDYYANDRDCKNPYYHFAIGKYLKCFSGNTYSFIETSKGYSCEFLNTEVLGWCYLPTEEEMEMIQRSENESKCN